MIQEEAMTTKPAESPSVLRTWWMEQNLKYDVTMGIIIIILNIVALKYIITNKIPLTTAGGHQFLIFSSICGIFYMFIIGQVIQYYMYPLPYSYLVGRTLHTVGFGGFLDYFYAISPHLALYLGLPCLLWFIVFMIGPSYKKLRDWWKFGRISQSASDVAEIV